MIGRLLGDLRRRQRHGLLPLLLLHRRLASIFPQVTSALRLFKGVALAPLGQVKVLGSAVAIYLLFWALILL